jgi:hypothetical protein
MHLFNFRATSVIQSRQEAIAFFSQPTQLETMKLMQGALKNVKRVTVYLKRLTSNQAQYIYIWIVSA